MRKAKIVCTLGPATDRPGVLEAMVAAGMDVARLNFSHGEHKDHEPRLLMARKDAEAPDRPGAVIKDLKGPKIRTGRMKGGRIRLEAGKEVAITTKKLLGTPTRFSTTYEGLIGDVKIGDEILLA